MKILLKIRAPSSGDLVSGVVPYGYSNLKISSLHVFPAFKTLKSRQALHVFSMNIRHFMQTFAIVKNDHCERLVVPSLKISLHSSSHSWVRTRSLGMDFAGL